MPAYLNRPARLLGFPGFFMVVREPGVEGGAVRERPCHPGCSGCGVPALPYLHWCAGGAASCAHGLPGWLMRLVRDSPATPT